MPAKVLAIGAAMAFAAGCSTETHTVVVTEDVCATYGFSTASPQYRECVARETAARALGRAQPGYSSARLMLDSQTACQSYGLVPYTDMYERCVRREYAYRTPA